MAGVTYPDLTIDAPLERTNEVLMALLGNLSGSSNYGVPQYELTGDYIDPSTGLVDDRYFRRFETTEPTLGQLSDWIVNSQTALRINNNGLSGDMPLSIDNTGDFAGDVTVGGNLGVAGDAAVGGNLGVTGDTVIGGALSVALTSELTGDVHMAADLVVDLTSTLTGHVGIGQAPAAGTIDLIVAHDTQIVGKFSVGEAPSTDAVRITGLTSVAGNIVPRTDNARDLGTSSLQWRNIYTEALTADSPTLVVDSTNHRVGLGIAAPAYANHLEGDTAIDVNTAIPTFFVQDSTHKIGVLTATPSATLEIAAFTRISGSTGTPAAGAGLELYWDGANTIMQSYDRTAAAYKPAYLIASDVHLWGNTSERIRVDATGLRFYNGGAGVAQPAAAAAATDLATVITLANSLRTGLRALSLFG